MPNKRSFSSSAALLNDVAQVSIEALYSTRDPARTFRSQLLQKNVWFCNMMEIWREETQLDILEVHDLWPHWSFVVIHFSTYFGWKKMKVWNVHKLLLQIHVITFLVTISIFEMRGKEPHFRRNRIIYMYFNCVGILLQCSYLMPMLSFSVGHDVWSIRWKAAKNDRGKRRWISSTTSSDDHFSWTYRSFRWRFVVRLLLYH